MAMFCATNLLITVVGVAALGLFGLHVRANRATHLGGSCPFKDS
jgi:hypothetical protein